MCLTAESRGWFEKPNIFLRAYIGETVSYSKIQTTAKETSSPSSSFPIKPSREFRPLKRILFWVGRCPFSGRWRRRRRISPNSRKPTTLLLLLHPPPSKVTSFWDFCASPRAAHSPIKGGLGNSKEKKRCENEKKFKRGREAAARAWDGPQLKETPPPPARPILQLSVFTRKRRRCLFYGRLSMASLWSGNGKCCCY